MITKEKALECFKIPKVEIIRCLTHVKLVTAVFRILRTSRFPKDPHVAREHGRVSARGNNPDAHHGKALSLGFLVLFGAHNAVHSQVAK